TASSDKCTNNFNNDDSFSLFTSMSKPIHARRTFEYSIWLDINIVSIISMFLVNAIVLGYLFLPVLSDEAGLSSKNFIFPTLQINSNATIRDSSCDLNIWFSLTLSINSSSETPYDSYIGAKISINLDFKSSINIVLSPSI